jgi:hypothetical protein
MLSVVMLSVVVEYRGASKPGVYPRVKHLKEASLG